MYGAIATRSASPASAAALMHETLAANFCPFRSPDWNRLASRNESIAFSRALWADVLDVSRPRVLICLGDTASHHLTGVMDRKDWRLVDTPSEGRIAGGTTGIACRATRPRAARRSSSASPICRGSGSSAAHNHAKP